MIITNNASAPKPVTTTTVRNALNTGAGSDFMSAMEKMLTDQPAANESTETVNYYDRGSVRWTDERYAGLVGGQAHIDTTKTMNWASKGDKELTEEQIAYLKEKYDIHNMSSQDYYDLMSDLTHMEALSPDDCIGVQLHTVGAKVNTVYFIPGSRPQRRMNTTPAGDLIDYFMVDLKERLADEALFSSLEFAKVNSHLTALDIDREIQAVQKDVRELEKVLSVLKLLA